jgi:hypothetical protein
LCRLRIGRARKFIKYLKKGDKMTSKSLYIDNYTIKAYLNEDLKVIEASQANLLKMDIKRLVKCFNEMEVFDNGHIVLKNYLGDYVKLSQ